MTKTIDPQKTKVRAKPTARLQLAASNAGAALAKANPYEFQPGSRQLLPMLAELKEMRRHLAEDWPKANLHDLGYSVKEGRCTQAEADRDQVELCRRIDTRLTEFDKAIAAVQALLDLGSPIG